MNPHGILDGSGNRFNVPQQIIDVENRVRLCDMNENLAMDLASIREQLKGSFPDLMGIQFLEASPGRVTASLVARPDLCTVGNILHGGAIMAFADTLGAVATAVNLTTGSTTTIESKTNFLKAVPVNSRILGECTPLHRGSRTMVWQTRITFDDGKLIALVIQTQLIIG